MQDVLFALQAHLACLLGTLLALQRDEIAIADDFGTDESFLEIGMYDARGLRCSVPLVNRPGAHFFYPGSEVSL